MYHIDNIKIGKYLSVLIDNNFKSRRDFCRKYLELAGEPNVDDALDNMSNRVSQILNGKKAIQTHDILIFAEILDITCDDILTAGEARSKKTSRMTNYNIIFSDDKELWEEYIAHPEKPFFNKDEYGKSSVDYAVKHNRYAFLKYIVEKGYKIDRLDNRYKIIGMAIREGDLDILKELNAREMFTQEGNKLDGNFEKDKYQDIISNILDALAKTRSKAVINYFSGEFIQLTDELCCLRCFYMMSELVEVMIKKRSRYTDLLLLNLIRHNENVLKLYEKLFDYQEDRENTHEDHDDTVGDCSDEIDVITYDSFLSKLISKDNVKRFVILCVSIYVKSPNINTQGLIDEVNASSEAVNQFLLNNIRKNNQKEN